MAASKNHSHTGLIFVLSFTLTLLLFYIDESKHSLGFLARPHEMFMVIFFTLIFSGVPFAIYGFRSDRNKKKSLALSMIGFLPPLAILFRLAF